MGNCQGLLRFFGIAAAAGMAALTGTAHAQSGGAFAAEATYQSGSIYASNESANGTGGVASLIYRVQPQLNINDNTRCTGTFVNLCPQITGATELNESVGGTASGAGRA